MDYKSFTSIILKWQNTFNSKRHSCKVSPNPIIIERFLSKNSKIIFFEILYFQFTQSNLRTSFIIIQSNFQLYAPFILYINHSQGSICWDIFQENYFGDFVKNTQSFFWKVITKIGHLQAFHSHAISDINGANRKYI